jgi:hypothetical protein
VQIARRQWRTGVFCSSSVMCLSRGHIRLVSIETDSKHAAGNDWWIGRQFSANRERGMHVGPSFAEGREPCPCNQEEVLSLDCRPVILNI